jgi:asparagine synthase (glutamine-hydrolysing)
MPREELTPLEVASGLVLGRAPRPLPSPDGRGPLATLESLVRAALERPPCLVSFSGGRDSSAVLAVAVRLARREGLALPVPATHRFNEAEQTDERDWQERVVRTLRLDDWVRIENTDELDVVGPVAAGVLRRHGLLWPSNVHFHAPLLEAAAGGSLLTGIGGDEAFSSSQWSRARAVATGHARPELRDVLRLGLALSPTRLRRRVLRRRTPGGFGWLRPEAHDAVWDALVDGWATEPLGWGSRIRWLAGTRYLQVGTDSLARLGADVRVQVVNPLADRRFLAALTPLPRRKRFADRTAAMRSIFGELLPDAILARETKAGFDEAFWRRHSRAFAAAWNGEGADPALVDAEALRAEWTRERPDARTFTLLQAAWLERGRASGRLERVEETLTGVGQ